MCCLKKITSNLLIFTLNQYEIIKNSSLAYFKKIDKMTIEYNMDDSHLELSELKEIFIS